MSHYKLHIMFDVIPVLQYLFPFPWMPLIGKNIDYFSNVFLVTQTLKDNFLMERRKKFMWPIKCTEFNPKSWLTFNISTVFTVLFIRIALDSSSKEIFLDAVWSSGFFDDDTSAFILLLFYLIKFYTKISLWFVTPH